MEHLRRLTHFLFSAAIILALGLMVVSCQDDNFSDVEDQVDITLETDDDGEIDNPVGGSY